ncbi:MULTISPECIES: sulfite exporter TauE/SafE family protein [Legionella]|uniref:Probable membrane transporter protein n=1 Tax=Legionella septentrionalis TaxID=2498109 RepID=A0A3S0XUA1_9GAMM|nr:MULTISPECIES: sulfite exporter TauE/SafE family protein [Legionella]MCP0913989.1 sulfite exporter TauE/SafE family protein [Legionella sp. 27cVA30]RUQ90355.1 sulfite exporter TauE/SafE family protein [Legionella septentrionalis]RUR00006.1 sulfite exporter TauE/SafE family protein [Legionella septentrionalis]RUR10702.1 sulfite exporter TauE/SafE family protein [Legionella septentrionalis]RUR16545.1 sulfite exporter TauE/SafE family protein [Legionella septentrionalis]
MLSQILLFALVGFCAQMVDGALGMAYGVISTGVLVSFGVSPAVASASVHTAEIVTTGISGFSHAMFKNVDYALFRRLVIPGMIGCILGVLVLTKIPDYISKPFIASYLILVGCFILYKVFQEGKVIQSIKNFVVKKVLHRKPSDHARGIMPLGFFGGFFDAAGGGGWGPIVSSTLLMQGATPHYTIGSVNLTEFIITLTVSSTFFFTMGIGNWPLIAGLILGGGICAPLAAVLVRRLHPQIVMLLAGSLIVCLGIYTIAGILF